LLLRLLLLHHLLLHLYSLGHSLLHLSHHWVHRLLSHHRICCLLLHHHHLHRVHLHLRLLGLRLLSLIAGIAHQVKKIHVSSSSILRASAGITRVAASVVTIAFVLLTTVLSVNVTWVKHSLLSGFTGNKLCRLSVFLNGSISLKCLMEVIVNNEAH